MLERIPKTRLILDQATKQNRKLVAAAIRVQTPIVEAIRPEFFCDDFRELAPLLELPVKPSRAMIKFASEVAGAWDELTFQERKELGLPEPFRKKPNVLSYMFFGRKGNCSQRLGLLIHNAEKCQRDLEIGRLLKKLLHKELSWDRFRQSMRKFGMEIDLWTDVRSIGTGVMYMGRTKLCRVTARIPDLGKALEQAEAEELRLRIEIARRLTVGYNPAF